jgi:Transposase
LNEGINCPQLLLLKNNQDLSALEQDELRELFQHSSVLEYAYYFKEEIRQIYETDLTVKTGLRKMQQWLKYARLFFASIADTLDKHLPEIANYFF